MLKFTSVRKRIQLLKINLHRFRTIDECISEFCFINMCVIHRFVCIPHITLKFDFSFKSVMHLRKHFQHLLSVNVNASGFFTQLLYILIYNLQTYICVVKKNSISKYIAQLKIILNPRLHAQGITQDALGYYSFHYYFWKSYFQIIFKKNL